MTTISIADALFTKTQQSVLRLLFVQPDKSFYANEIVRLVGMGRGTVRRELEKLVSAQLLTITQAGNQHRYQANKDSPIYNELHQIVIKTSGIVDVLKQALQPMDEQIQLAFVFGSIAKGTETNSSDIDLMLVGNGLQYSDVMELLMSAEPILQRPINPTLYTPEDFQSRLKDEQSFIMRVKEQPKLMIKGEINDIGKPV